MPVETAPPVRSEVQKPPAHAHAHHGAKRAGAADAPDAAATGFSALLGAAGQAGAAPSDADTDTTGLAPAKGRKSGKVLVGGVDAAATLAAMGGFVKPAITVPTTQLAGGTAAAGSAAGVVGVAGAATAPGAVAALGRGAHVGKPPQAGAPLAGQALPKLIAPGAKPDAPVALPVPDATALQTGTSTAATGAPGAATHGLAAAAGGQQVPPGALTGAQQLRANDIAAQAALAAPGRVQSAAASGADSASVQGVAVSTSGTASLSDGDGRPSRGGASTVSLGDGAGRWAGMLSDIGRAPPSEGGAGAFSGGGQSRGQGAEGDRRGGDGLASSAVGFAPSSSPTTDGNLPATSSGTEAQQASGSAMTPDEWLAATTPAVNSHGVQKAELTLDAFGAPVDVQISLSGNDAQVSFQSDQADTRAALVGAMSDLQNLLQQEGLVLSGVTVGGSGAQGNGAATADSGGRGDARRAARADSAPVEALAAAPARPRPTSAGSGALDVFA